MHWWQFNFGRDGGMFWFAAAAAAGPASGSAPHYTAGNGLARTIYLVVHEQHHAFPDRGPHGR